MDTINKKERIIGIEFARACCAIGIIIYHYFCHSSGNFKILYTTANDTWGGMFVTCFFAISGFVLFYNYPKINSLSKFYFKRWKSIFPPYYLCFFLFFLRKAIQNHSLFYKGNPLKLFFTFFGMDGYFLYKFDNYYIVGEWFLGAIIMLYLLYPFIIFIVNKNNFILPCLFAIGYIFMYSTDFFEIEKSRNLITCASSFYIGILFVNFKDFLFNNKVFGLTAFAILIITIHFKLPNFILFHQIQGLLLLIVLIQTGNYIMKTLIGNSMVEISRLSFCIFLLQHMVILDIQRLFNPSEWYKILIILSIVIITTILCAKILQLIVSKMLNTSIFSKIENKFLA